MLAREQLKKLIENLPQSSKILDVGCGTGSICKMISDIRKDIIVYGVDRAPPPPSSNKIFFKICDLETDQIPHDSNYFDLVICQHVIEHVHNSTNLFGDIARVTKPGGKIFFEAPSDHSVWFSFPWAQNWRLIMSYYDDPTHIGRPWTPQAFYRLGLFWGMRPDLTRYEFSLLKLIFLVPLMLIGWARRDPDIIVETWWQATGWVCFSTFTKPDSLEKNPKFSYVSYKGYPPA